MLTESKKQVPRPSKEDMEDLAKSFHAMNSNIGAVARKMHDQDISYTMDGDIIALWSSLYKAYTACEDAAGMLETVLSHKEVDA